MKLQESKGMAPGPMGGMTPEVIHKMQQYQQFLLNPNKTPEEEKLYNLQMASALNASNMDEVV